MIAAHKVRSWKDATDRAIKPHTAEIAEIGVDGDIAVVFHDLDMTDVGIAAMVAVLRGARGTTANVVRLPRSRARRIFGSLDPVTVRWMSTRPPEGQIKIFLVIEAANYLVNCSEERGYWLEPGSTDGEYLS